MASAISKQREPTAENFEIARVMDEVGDLLEIRGENPFRIRAYRTAARVIRELPEQVSDRLKDPDKPLSELPGIGKDLAEKIRTLTEIGKFPLLDQLQKKVPEGLREMLTIPGLGPKRALILYKKLKIQSKDALLKAAENHKIRSLKGFGPKSEENILSGIKNLQSTSQRFHLAEAKAYAEALERYLKASGVERVAIAGSLRRWKDTIGDVDFIVCCEDPRTVMDRLGEYETVTSVLGRGPTKMTVRLKNGMQIDVRVVPTDSFGAAMLYFTGSKAHNIELRRRALKMKLKINEYGVFRGNKKIAGLTEEEVYSAVKLPWIPPELREARGEIELAEMGKLPRLVEWTDIKGDLHSHTDATDGRATLEEMAMAAKNRGLHYLAITDHSKRVTMAKGLTAARLRNQWKKIDRLNEKLNGFRVLKGIELDILEDGTLDLPDDVLSEADWVIASIHYGQKQSKAEVTRRVLSAISSPYVCAIAHPTGRILGRRDEYQIDLEAVLRAARENGVAIEANGQPSRLDLDDVRIAQAKSAGVKVVVDSDAHSMQELYFMDFGVAQARRAGLEKEDVLNTRTREDFLEAIRKNV